MGNAIAFIHLVPFCLLHTYLWGSACSVQEALRGTAACPAKGRAKSRQLDQPTLTPLSVAGCCRWQLVVAYWATSVAILKFIITPENSGSRFSSVRLLPIEDFTFQNLCIFNCNAWVNTRVFMQCTTKCFHQYTLSYICILRSSGRTSKEYYLLIRPASKNTSDNDGVHMK